MTALDKEYAAACEIFDCSAERSSSDGLRTYCVGSVKTTGQQGSHTVAILLLSHMGNNPSAAAGTSMLADCPKMNIVIMCGIAGAVPNPKKVDSHVRLGDIVALGAQGIVQYDFVKRLSGNRAEFRFPPRPPANVLLQAALRLRAKEAKKFSPWDVYIDNACQSLGTEWHRPDSSTDILRDGTGPLGICCDILNKIGFKLKHRQIEHPKDTSRPTGKPKIFIDAIASSNALLKDETVRNHLREEYGTKAVEMEGSGLADATHQRAKQYFIVRGTCDYCNDDKGDAWQKYAAVIAAAYTRALVEALPVRFLEGEDFEIGNPHDGGVPVESASITPVDSPQDAISVATSVVDRLINENERRVPAEEQVQIASVNTPIVPLRESTTQKATALVSAGGAFYGHSFSSMNPKSEPKIGFGSYSMSAFVVAHKSQAQPSTPKLHESNHPLGSEAPPIAVLNSNLKSLLEERANRWVEEIEHLLGVWEFDRAAAHGEELLMWLHENEHILTGLLRSTLYEQLARIEFSIVRNNAGSEESADFSKAKFYLKKAKDAAAN